MDAIETLTRILGLSFVSGINLYATVLVVGLGIHYGWVGGLPPELAVLAHPAVLTVAGILYALEFLAAKIPVVNLMWDAIHTFIRPAGAALLALAVVSHIHMDARVQVIAVMVGAAVALGVHSTRMSIRLLAHAAPHPVVHAGISLLEDGGVIALLALMYLHPLAALILLSVLIASIALAGPLLFRTLSLVIRAVAGRIVFWPSRSEVPVWLAGSLGGLDAIGAGIYMCFARSVPNVPRIKKGYLIRNVNGAFLVCKRYGKARPLGTESAADKPVRGWVLDVITFCDAWGATSSVYLTKDHARRFHADSQTFNRASQ